MASRKPKPDEEIFEGLDPEDEDYLAFLEEMGPSAATIDIYRMPNMGQGGRRPFVDTIPADTWRSENPLIFLRDKYGAGKYLCQFRDSSRKIRGSRVFEIDPPPAAHTPHNNGNSFEQQHIQLLREQNEKQQTLLMTLLASNRGPDMGTLLTGLGTVLGAVNRPAPTFDPSAMLSSVVTAFTALRGPVKEENGVEHALKLISIAREVIDPQSGVPDNPWSLLKEVGREVVSRIQLPAGNPPPPAAPVDITPNYVPAGGQTAAAAPTQTPPPASGGMMEPQQVAQLIAAGLSYLKLKAMAGKDVNVYIDRIFDEEDEPQWMAILGAMRQGVTFEQLLQFDAEIANNPALKQWFFTLYEAIRSELFNTPMDSRGPGGNENNPPQNAGAGTQGQGGAAPLATSDTVRKSAGD